MDVNLSATEIKFLLDVIRVAWSTGNIRDPQTGEAANKLALKLAQAMKDDKEGSGSDEKK